jgi:hypothetical protein
MIRFNHSRISETYLANAARCVSEIKITNMKINWKTVLELFLILQIATPVVFSAVEFYLYGGSYWEALKTGFKVDIFVLILFFYGPLLFMIFRQDGLKNILHKIIREYRVRNCKFATSSDWNDDLIWCPSQCIKKISYKKRHFVIYLRWRHSDPWTADLIECKTDGKYNYDNAKWIQLPVKFWTDEQLSEIKEDAEYLVKQWLVDNGTI